MLGIALLPACSRTSQPLAPPPSPTPDRLVLAQRTLTEAVAAGLAHDADRFADLVSPRDPTFAARADVWFDNLSTTPWQQVSFTALPGAGELPAARRSVLGPDAWVQPVAVRWQLRGAARPAEQRIWITLVPEEGRARLAGDGDRPPGSDPGAVPVWLLERLTVEAEGSILVVTANRSAAPDWMARAKRAVAEVDDAVDLPAEDWRRDLVVVVPSSRPAFERVLGVTPGSYRDIAAAAWPMAADAADAPVHVVVNPDKVAGLDGAGLRVLLDHEVTHVATHSVDSPAPTWLVEGYADQIGYSAEPRAHHAAEAVVLAEIRQRGAPEKLPTDDEFDPDAGRLDQTYGEAWLACDYISRTYGADRLDRFYAAVDDGNSVDEAVADVLGTTTTRLVQGWISDLRQRVRAS